jgi:peptidoglycan/xylan/chitin deacetylase (PgdA/CDA1 family)
MVDFPTTIVNLRKSYHKNIAEVRALANRHYPEFVYACGPATLRDEIPVFTFHSVEPRRFETQLRFLAQNGYQTLTADEVCACLTHRRPIPERAICVTFDDGWASVWAVAYPLLKRFGMKAVCFLVPGLIGDSTARHPNLDDVAAGAASLAEIGGREASAESLCTWAEIRRMHADGVIDFQSHSMYHGLIFTSPEIVDFINPSYDFYKMNFNVPVIRYADADRFSRQVEWGTPIYAFDSRFSGKRRYFDDPAARSACTEFVASKGGAKFFDGSNWRRRLRTLVQMHRRTQPEAGRFESDEESRQSILDDLVRSKKAIECQLPHKAVRHFCYPWWVGSALATNLSKRAGYESNFLGILPERRTRNRAGDDPFRIGRLLSDEYIFRLPGTGRKSFGELLHDKGKAGLESLSRKMKRSSGALQPQHGGLQ